MHKTAKALLEAHVAFEVERLCGDSLDTDIRQLTEQFLASEAATPLSQWVDADQVRATLKRCILDIPLSSDFGDLVREIAAGLYHLPDSEKTALKDIVPREDVVAWVGKALSLRELRELLIHRGMRSTIYRELVADILFAGITSYLTEANAISKNVPGAKKMMQMGKGWINKAAPALEERVTTQVKKSINANLSEVIEHGEAFITESISEDHLHDIALNIWDAVAEQPITSIKDYVGADDFDALVALGYQQFDDVRGQAYIASLVNAGVAAFYQRYGDEPLQKLLDELGIDAELITAEALNYAPGILGQLRESGFLQSWLEERLGAFYQSDAAEKILKSS